MCYFPHWIAAWRVAPDEPPTNNPSSEIILLAISKVSLSPVLNQSSIISGFLSITLGTKSYPVPSTKYGSFLVLRVYGIAKIEPCGSTPITLTPGINSFNFLAIPQMAPPVPVPMKTAVNLLSQAQAISAPVPS